MPLDSSAHPGTPAINPEYTAADLPGTGALDTKFVIGTPGVAATGTFTIAGTFQAAQNITVHVGGVPYVTASVTSFAATAAAIAANIGNTGLVTATSLAAEVTITANAAGAPGNAITIAATSPAGTNTITASGATLSGGSDDIPLVVTPLKSFAFVYGGQVLTFSFGMPRVVDSELATQLLDLGLVSA
jgi:phage tail sheath gpL-like